MKKHLLKELKNISLSMFRKNFLGIFHGSLSARIEHNRILINKKDTIFDETEDSDFIELFSKKDYRWNEASFDADIHLNIYKNINEAKYISYTMPPFTTSFSLEVDTIIPKDYFGSQKFGMIEVYDPKQFDDWYERAEIEIYRYFKENKTNIIVIKGYGVYAYDRDIKMMSKTVAILENSCKLLYYANQIRK